MDDHKFREGEIVCYHDRFGIVIEAYGLMTELRPIYKILFFEEDKEAILDEAVIRSANTEIDGIDNFLLKYCNCGERHTKVPSTHSPWCKVSLIKGGKLNEKLGSDSKVVVE
jgi:hypothetical protein